MERLLTFKGIIKAFLKSYNTLLDKVEVYDEKEALLIENNVEKVYDILHYVNDRIKNENFLEPWSDYAVKYNILLKCYEKDLKTHEESGHYNDYMYDY